MEPLVKALGLRRPTRLPHQHMIEPSLYLTASTRNWLSGRSALTERFFPTGTVRLAGTRGASKNLAGYGEVAWWVRCRISLAARLLGDPAGKSRPRSLRAPGGKTLQLCAMGAESHSARQFGQAP